MLRRSPANRYRLQSNYNGDFESFKAYCRIYGIHTRLGFRSMKAAWEANPVVEIHTNPSKFRAVIDRRFTKGVK